MARILIVDDDVAIRDSIQVLLALDGHEVVQAEDGHQGEVEVRRLRPDVVIVDIFMPQQDGFETIRSLRADGMTVVGYGEPTHLRTQAREVFDVSGAGDTVIATVAAALASGADMVSAAALANIAGGIVVEKVGTAAIRNDDIARFINDSTHHVDLLTQPHGRTIAPVYSWIEAKEQIDRWRARGLKVGFTNGCFDLIHQGHVTMLDRCRAQCDKLVLGLNCDASVARLKGPTRPVNGEQARARVDVEGEPDSEPVDEAVRRQARRAERTDLGVRPRLLRLAITSSISSRKAREPRESAVLPRASSCSMTC